MKLTSVFRTNQFKRDAKALFKKHYDDAKLADAIEALIRQNREELRIIQEFAMWTCMCDVYMMTCSPPPL